MCLRNQATLADLLRLPIRRDLADDATVSKFDLDEAELDRLKPVSGCNFAVPFKYRKPGTVSSRLGVELKSPEQKYPKLWHAMREGRVTPDVLWATADQRSRETPIITMRKPGEGPVTFRGVLKGSKEYSKRIAYTLYEDCRNFDSITGTALFFTTTLDPRHFGSNIIKECEVLKQMHRSIARNLRRLGFRHYICVAECGVEANLHLHWLIKREGKFFQTKRGKGGVLRLRDGALFEDIQCCALCDGVREDHYRLDAAYYRAFDERTKLGQLYLANAWGKIDVRVVDGVAAGKYMAKYMGKGYDNEKLEQLRQNDPTSKVAIKWLKTNLYPVMGRYRSYSVSRNLSANREDKESKQEIEVIVTEKLPERLAVGSPEYLSLLSLQTNATRHCFMEVCVTDSGCRPEVKLLAERGNLVEDSLDFREVRANSSFPRCPGCQFVDELWCIAHYWGVVSVPWLANTDKYKVIISKHEDIIRSEGLDVE